MSSLLNLLRNASVRVVNWPTALKSPTAKGILNKAVKRKLLEQPIRQVNDHIFAKFLPTKASHLNHYQSPSTKSKSLENSSSGMTCSIYLLSVAKQHMRTKALESEVGVGLGPGAATVSFTFLRLPLPPVKMSRISPNAQDCCEV